MKKIILIFIVITGFFGTSCNKFLDINTNPNSATSATPATVLPLAIVNTGNLVSSLNDYGGRTVGYSSNAGGYGGFAEVWTYDYPTTEGSGYWSSGYYVVQNLEANIIEPAKTDASLANYDGAAKILKAYVFQQLIDEFNDIPYSQAFLGAGNLTPAYDKATDIYPELASLLDSAISEINGATNADAISSSSDPLFGGDMKEWKQFANTLKLRLIIRASSVVKFNNETFSSDGFLADDAIVNPGYGNTVSSSGAQTNPSWASWVVNYAGSSGNRSYIPADYVYGFYDGTKLDDSARGAAIYYNFPNTPTSQLGQQGLDNSYADPGKSGAWYSATDSTVGDGGTSLGNKIGVMKGPNMGEPLMLLAEADFLEAEADLRGFWTGTAEDDFKAGIHASFHYLYELPTRTIAAGLDPDADADKYIAKNENASNGYLVNLDKATSTAQKMEAIITQKYIALNFIHGQEAWSEYRRTGYPKSTTPINNPYGSFASLQSQATRTDKLPTRLPYPNTEYSTNAANIPQNISVYTSLIFWAKQ